ncbi:turripeptide Gsg9.2 isoform X2 [Drosophila subobscura]|uniref:turripeptide Gsg9.2 isoform X2 n=1 Tax=Drosophila subobscura TaxID=7241 RepID=UPI00155AB740|nr:turripeptide Gsg9.2 isoform X2 [Drosophila subobscura]
MKSLCIVLLIALSCLALAEGQCPRVCTRLFSPVCATWTRRGITDVCTFPNTCTLRNQNCQRNQNWIIRTNAACRVETRDCIVIRQ